MMKPRTHVIIALSFATVASGFRRKNKELMNATSGAFSAAPGALLDEEYQLISLIRAGIGTPSTSSGEENSTSFMEEEMPWPTGFEGLGAKFGRDPTRAGEGAFGEVWLAKHVRSGTNVAVKLFKNGRGGHVMCGTGHQWSAMLKDASDECKLAQTLTDGKEAKRDPIGSSRIAKCLKDEVRANLRARVPTPCYLVLENGGKPLSKWIESQRASGKNNPQQARVIVKQLLQAVKFMSTFVPAYIHHDMKPDNAVYSMENGKPVVKLIDWGCAIQASSEYQQSQVDPEYAPPEYSMTGGVQAYASPAHSFDIFQVGLMYMELMCPNIHPESPHAVDRWGRRLPKSLWFKEVPRSAHFRQAGCCVDDADSNRCVTRRDIGLMQHMLGHSWQRPHPNNILHDPLFHDLKTAQETAGETKFAVGELVEYLSTTYNGWIAAEIITVNADGTYELDIKRGSPISEDKIRPASGAKQVKQRECPQGSIPYKSDKCICDAEHGFVLSLDKTKCEEARLQPTVTRPPDQPWCKDYSSRPDFFINYCIQHSIRKYCANACALN